MAVSSVTVTKTNISLAPGQSEIVEAKVNHDDGHSDYNYRVAVRPENVIFVRHSGAQIVVGAGKTGGQASLRIISNHNPAVAVEVKVLVAGGGLKAAATSEADKSARYKNVAEVFRPPVPASPVAVPSFVPEPVEGQSASFSNSAFIDQLYRDILHRPADSAGRNYWTRMLDRKLYTRDEVREAFDKSR